MLGYRVSMERLSLKNIHRRFSSFYVLLICSVICCFTTSVPPAFGEETEVESKGDSLKANRGGDYGYLAFGFLNGGAFPLTSSSVPSELHYPSNTGVLNFGLCTPLFKLNTLGGYFNMGIPLRNMYLSTTYGSRTISQKLNMVSLYFDIGLIYHPLRSCRPNAKIQPFIGGGIGFTIFAENWQTLLLLLILSSDSAYTPGENDILTQAIEFDLFFTFGGGIDYYLSPCCGLRLFVKQNRINLPAMSGSITPLEVQIGLFFDSDTP